MKVTTVRLPIAILKPLRMQYNVDPEWIVMGGNLKSACDFRIEQEVYPYDLSRSAALLQKS